MALDLTREVPAFYIDQDDDVAAFLDALSEALQQVRDDVDSLRSIYDPARTKAAVLRWLLRLLGWSDPFPLTEAQQRRLAAFIRRLLRLRGTLVGIENMVRVVTGIDVIAENLARTEENGYPWPPGAPEWYTFVVSPMREISAEEEALVRACIDYMKPPHVRYVLYGLAAVDHWELGVSQIDRTAWLH